MIGVRLPPAAKIVVGALLVAAGLVIGLPVVAVVGGVILVMGLFGIGGRSGSGER